jgi:sugar lactone lactonase YvrE
VLASLGDISVGTTADIDGNNEEFAFAGKHGFSVMNRKTGEWEYVKKYWGGDAEASREDDEMWGNDGGVDSCGRYWVGFTNNPSVKAPTEVRAVLRLDPDMSLHRMIEGISIPNGINWSNDDTTMYFNDLPSKNITAYDYDIETGAISGPRTSTHVEDEGDVPDGHALDEKGHL